MSERLGRFKKIHQIRNIKICSAYPFRLEQTDPERDSVEIVLSGINGRNVFNFILARDFRRGICASCVLKNNPEVNCTQMRDPGEIKYEGGDVSLRIFPSAQIKSKSRLSTTFWKALASMVPCEPDVDF